MRMSEIKTHCKELAAKIKNAKCEAKCANRLAYFNSYDTSAVNRGRWNWPYAGGGCSDWESTAPRKVTRLWDKHEVKKSEINKLKTQYQIDHTAYCILRGRTIEQIFHPNSNGYFLGDWFMKEIQKRINEWEVQDEEALRSCEG